MKKSDHEATRLPTFWKWFWRGNGEKPGIRRLIGWHSIVHLVIGFVAACAVAKPLKEVSAQALLPLIAIFVGLTFSWAGNAHTILQSREVVKLAGNRPGGIAEYIFTFQLCIFVVLFSVIAWILPILSATYLLGGFIGVETFNYWASVALYALISLAFRTSWQAVLGANMLLLARVHSSEQ